MRRRSFLSFFSLSFSLLFFSLSRAVGRPRPAQPPLPDFHKGEMVLHKAFGKGMILTLTPMGGDALIEGAFDNVGTKKLMLRSAEQYMEKL